MSGITLVAEWIQQVYRSSIEVARLMNPNGDRQRFCPKAATNWSQRERCSLVTLPTQLLDGNEGIGQVPNRFPNDDK